jgi:hypothetical protein
MEYINPERDQGETDDAYDPTLRGLPSLELAYKNLLETRDDNLYIVSNEAGITEDDILCNTNLRTASLFKGYNIELKKLQAEYNILLNDDEMISKAFKDFMCSMQLIKNKVAIYHNESTDTIETNHIILERSMGSVEFVIQNEIQMKKSTLDVKIDRVTRKLNTLRKLIQAGLDELIDKDDANNKKMCAICFDREVDMVMVPCGHTTCNGCSDHNKTNKCMICRSVIQKRIKMFFSM